MGWRAAGGEHETTDSRLMCPLFQVGGAVGGGRQASEWAAGSGRSEDYFSTILESITP